MIRSVIVLVLLFLVAVVLLAYFGQRKMIFPAPQSFQPYASQKGVELIQLEAGHAFLASPTIETEKAPLIVFAHGNAELAHWSIDSFAFFRDRGFAVLLLEYPGYGGSAGSPGERSIEKSALDALDQVAGRDDIDENRIIAHGRSIGSGIACRIAIKRNVAAVVLESPFLSLRKLASELGMPAFILRDRFDNVDALKAIDAPVFLYHGTKDRIIPVTHSERLSEIANDAVLMTVECGHNDCPRPWYQLLDFFKTIGIINDMDTPS